MRSLRLVALVAAGLIGGLVAVPGPAASAVARCEGVRATIVGTDGSDTLVGTSGPDVIVARAGADTIEARGGDDLVCAGGGPDTVEGGPGDDRLHGGEDGSTNIDGVLCVTGDRLDGGSGSDLLDPGRDPRQIDADCGARDLIRFRHGGGVTVDLPAGRASGQGDDHIVVDQALEVVGSDGDDVLVGTDRAERFDGGLGDDRVEAAGGGDELLEPDTANGNDTYLLGAGRDFLTSQRGRDVVRADSGADDLQLASPAPTDADGGAGADTVNRYVATTGDALAGGGGRDELDVTLLRPRAVDASLDIPAGTLTVGDRVIRVGGFERWTFVARIPFTVVGSDAGEVIDAPGFGSPRATLTAHLGGGDDTAYSNTGDDAVDGGDGTDRADLDGGDNRCSRVERGPC